MIDDRKKFHRQWKSRKSISKPVRIENLKVLNLQDKDNQMLKQLKRFRTLKWFVESKVVNHG